MDPFASHFRDLVVGIDLGTTNSGCYVDTFGSMAGGDLSIPQLVAAVKSKLVTLSVVPINSTAELQPGAAASMVLLHKRCVSFERDAPNYAVGFMPDLER